MPTNKLADYAIVVDIMARMASLTSEAMAIERILSLFTELCAPEQLAYVSVIDGICREAHCMPPLADSEAVVRRMCEFRGPWSQTETGFALSVEHGGEQLGVLEVEGIAFPEQRTHYLNLALTIVEVLGLAISNARTHERLTRARQTADAERDLARDLLGLSDALNTINTTIAATLDFEAILDRVVIEAAEATGSDRVGLLRRTGGEWVLEHGYGYRPGRVGRSFTDEQLPFAARAHATGDVAYSNDAIPIFEEEPGGALSDDTRSIMNVPLMLRGEPFGVLSFRSRAKGTYTPLRIDFARKLSSSLSLALQNAQLFEAQRTIADTLQQALLVMPKHLSGIEFGNLYRAATSAGADVGGDFYDLFDIDHRLIGIVIGDISGKGLEAAKLTSLVKDGIRAFAHIGVSPGWIIENTNRLLFDSTSDSQFATVFFGVLDAGTGELTYCSAGHPPALIRAEDGVVRGLAVASQVVGAFETIEARDGTETLAPGEMLVLYTDGITEARCGDGFFGDERLVEVIHDADVSPSEMPGVVIEAVTMCSRSRLPDDAAILCVALAPGQAGQLA